jgi:hypothetical protein
MFENEADENFIYTFEEGSNRNMGKQNNEELHNINSLPDIFSVIELRRMNALRISHGRHKNAYDIFTGNKNGREPFFL